MKIFFKVLFLLVLIAMEQRLCDINVADMVDDKPNYQYDDDDDQNNNDDDVNVNIVNDPLLSSLQQPSLVLDNIEEVEKYCEMAESTNELVCTKIPNVCFDECKISKQIRFDGNVQKIEELSFQKYAFSDGMSFTIEFSSVNEIENDAFEGMFIDGDSELNVVLNGSVDATQRLQDAASIIIQSHAFRGIVMIPGAKLNVFFLNYKNIEFNENSLNGIKSAQEANVKFLIENNEAVYFHSRCASNWEHKNDDPVLILEENDLRAIENPTEELVFEDEEKQSHFQIKLTNVKKVKFDTMSFNVLQQAPSSVFQILIGQFESLEFDQNAFSSIKQSVSSKFELNLNDGKFVKFSEDLFRDVTQELKSQFIFSVTAISSSLCLPKHTIQNFKQGKNSSLSVNLVSMKYNLYVDNHAFVGLKQDDNSFIQIYGYKYFNAYFKGYSIDSLTQLNTSFFELWFSETGNLIFESNAFSKFTQVNGSTVRIGFTQSDGTFQQSPFVFDKLEQQVDSQFIYDFTQSANFELKFPPRQSPRMIAESDPSSLDNNVKILEELYPKLGKSNRPNRINLLEYELTADDFCKVADLPTDLVLQLAPKTQCSCSVYYLYRMIRRSKHLSESSWLAHVPQCYQETYQLARHGHEDMDQLELDCEFDTLIRNCKLNRLNQVFKLHDDFKCSTYNPANHDNYLTIELLNGKNVNLLEITNKTASQSKTIFDKINRVTLITVITMSIIFVMLIFLFTFLIIMLRLRKKRAAAELGLKSGHHISASVDTSDAESNEYDDVNTALKQAPINPIYKKKKAPSNESKDYLINSRQANESEQLQLVIQQPNEFSSLNNNTKIV